MNPRSESLCSELLATLPGGEYVISGLADLRAGRESLPALVLAIAAGRLIAAGLPVPGASLPDAELRLYRLLQKEHGDDAHGQYNAHLRRLTSLCQALEQSPLPRRAFCGRDVVDGGLRCIE